MDMNACHIVQHLEASIRYSHYIVDVYDEDLSSQLLTNGPEPGVFSVGRYGFQPANYRSSP